MTKLGFVGAGKIGSNAVYATLHRVEVDEIAVVDLIEDLAVGEAMDLNTSAAGLGLGTRVHGGKDYELLEGSDLVVVSAGKPREPGMTREDLLKDNAGIMRTIAEGIAEHASDARVLVVSNPVDALTWVAWKTSGFARHRVFGMGALHDTMRLWDILRDSGADFFDAWVLGPHGEQMFPARSLARVEGVDVDWADVKEQVRGRAMEIIERKGATYYAPGVAISRMVEAVVENEKAFLPVIAVLDGEFGQQDLAIGVPVILGAAGVERVVEVDLGEDQATFEKACESVAEQVETVRSIAEGNG